MTAGGPSMRTVVLPAPLQGHLLRLPELPLEQRVLGRERLEVRPQRPLEPPEPLLLHPYVAEPPLEVRAGGGGGLRARREAPREERLRGLLRGRVQRRHLAAQRARAHLLRVEPAPVQVTERRQVAGLPGGGGSARWASVRRRGRAGRRARARSALGRGESDWPHISSAARASEVLRMFTSAPLILLHSIATLSRTPWLLTIASSTEPARMSRRWRRRANRQTRHRPPRSPRRRTPLGRMPGPSMRSAALSVAAAHALARARDRS